ncbi:MAG TPA: galactokinase [Ktedonobacterales bacterium]
MNTSGNRNGNTSATSGAPCLPDPAREALAAYHARFGAAGTSDPVTVVWASGRINLIGEHTDYNQGWVLPVAVDRVVALAGQPIHGPKTFLYSTHHDEIASFYSDPWSLTDRRPGRLRFFARYVRAVLAQLVGIPGAARTPPFRAAIAGNVPVGGGMSSSAALEVAAATFAAALGGPALEPMATARLCQRAEQAGVGVEVGIMDQAASCLGRPGSALLLDCRSLAYEYVPINLPGIALAAFDTGVPRTLGASGYNDRTYECGEAVAWLADAMRADEPQRTVTALRDITADDLARYGATLPKTLLRRVRHVVSENARVAEAVDALRAGDAAQLGELLYASHASLRDDYEVSCPELDAAVEIASCVEGVVGARLMGAGFGGSALMLVREEAVDALRTRLTREYRAATGRSGALHICHIAGGPQTVTMPPA